MLTTRHYLSTACVAVGLLAVLGCDRDRGRGVTTRTEEQTGTATVTGAQVANTAAIDRVVAARCERESSCRNIGPDKQHATPQACTDKLRADMKDDLNTRDCPAGIDQKELNECLEAIRKEDCNNPIDTIGRLAACRTSDLCLKTGAPNR